MSDQEPSRLEVMRTACASMQIDAELAAVAWQAIRNEQLLRRFHEERKAEKTHSAGELTFSLHVQYVPDQWYRHLQELAQLLPSQSRKLRIEMSITGFFFIHYRGDIVTLEHVRRTFVGREITEGLRGCLKHQSLTDTDKLLNELTELLPYIFDPHLHVC